MPEGLVQQVRAGMQARRACLRVRLWPLPGSAQLLRQVAAEVLGVVPADSLPLVVVSAGDGVRSVAVARRAADILVDVPLADLVVGVPVGVSGDDPGDLLLTVSSSAVAAQRLHRLRAGWGAAGGGRAWMRLTAEPVASALARCGPLGPWLDGTSFRDGRLVFGGLEVDGGGAAG